MKLILLICLLCFGMSVTWAQTWGASTFSQTTNEANDIELNNLNESYVAGYYSGQTSFSPSNSLGSTQGNTDAFVAKYSSSGSVLWIRQFGGTLADRAIDLAIGPDQNIVVTGQFFGTVTFGSTTLTSAANSKDIFILKLDPAGNVLWARKEGGTGADNAYKLTVDNLNNIILTGDYQGVASIGSNTFTSTTDPSSGNPSADLFIAKYDPAGAPLWSISGYASYDDRGLSVATDAQNNIFFTGQFSNTLNFGGNTYTNTGINIGFLCKLNAAGQVQFFNQMKAGYVMPYDVEVNSNNEPIVTGDFLGSMLYYNQNGTSSIQNPYDKKIFVLKTSNTGQYIWNNTLGSTNELSARSLSIDPGNNIFVTGYFKCDLSQIQDSTEQIFNSVGFKDPYLLKVSNSGTRTYIKQFGGKQDDEGKGVAVKLSDRPVICGIYTEDLNFVSASGAGIPALGYDNFTFNPYFGMEPYHIFLAGDQSRNSFLTNHINAGYTNYNYFTQASADSLVGYIDAEQASHYVTVTGDTVHFCSQANLFYNSLTFPHFGPDYIDTWYDGSHNPVNTITSTGTYWVQHKRKDECFTDMDSIYAIKEPTPNLPLLTDDHGVNVNQPGPNYHNYHFCYPEGAIITFSNLAPGSTLTTIGNSVTFNGPGPHTLNQEFQYWVQVMNQYCMNVGSFTFTQDMAAPPDSISLSIAMNTSVPTRDSIEVCEGTPINFHGIDLIVNPNGNFYPSVYPPIDTVIWIIDGVPHINYDTAAVVYNPSSTGWHTVQIQVVKGYNNLCGLDTTVYTATKQFYIKVNPLPTWGTAISGGTVLCPGDSEYLVATNPNPNLHWSGANILWNNGSDSIEVNAPGWYNYTGMLTDPVSGCSTTLAFNHYVSVKVPPNIMSFPGDGVICPFDSLLMSVPNSFSSYLWIGPNGNTLSTTPNCYTTQVGSYTCQVTDAEGCVLVTTPFEVFQYSTPSLSVSPSATICHNETVDIQISYSGNASFVWNTGSTSDHLSTNVTGLYIVHVTQCGVTVTDSVHIVNGSFNASISVSDSVLCYGDTAVFTGSVPGASYEWSSGPVTGPTYSTTTTGTYSAIVTNSLGCTAETNAISIVNVPGSAPPLIPSQTICPGQNVTLSDPSSNTLLWYSMDTTVIYTGTTINLTNVQQDTSFLISYTTANSICGMSYSVVHVVLTLPPGPINIIGDSNLCVNQDGVFFAVTTDNIEWFANGTSLGSANPITIPFSTLNSNPVFSIELSNACFSTTQFDSVEIITPEALQLSDDTVSVCFFDSEVIFLDNTDLTSITWSGNFGSVVSENFTVHGNTTYTPITVTAIDQYGCATQSAIVYVNTSVYNLAPHLNFPNYCPGTSGNITAATTSDSVLWITPFGNSHNNPLNFTLSQQNSGNFYLHTWDDMGCLYVDTVVVPLAPVPNLNILPDTVFCANDIYTFYFPNDQNTYYWTTYGNSTQIPITFDQELILNVVTPDGCVGSDTLVVHAVNCDDALPNIITPNGDGINDYFIIDDAYSQLGNTLIIINRWGNKMFEASPYKNDWNGGNISDGVYFYLYYPKGIKEPGYVKHGFVHVFAN